MAKWCIYLINGMFVLLNVDMWKRTCTVAKDFDIVETWIWTQPWHPFLPWFLTINERNKWLRELNESENANCYQTAWLAVNT